MAVFVFSIGVLWRVLPVACHYTDYATSVLCIMQFIIEYTVISNVVTGFYVYVCNNGFSCNKGFTYCVYNKRNKCILTLLYYFIAK
jgi:hypothetical protein